MNGMWSMRIRLKRATWDDVFCTVVTLYCIAAAVAIAWLFIMVQIETQDLIDALNRWGR